MNERIQTTALSRRLVIIAIPVTIMVISLYIIVLIWLSPTASHPVLYVAPTVGIIVASITIWLELRLPRYVRFEEGVMILASFFGTRAIPDGDVLSLRNPFFNRGQRVLAREEWYLLSKAVDELCTVTSPSGRIFWKRCAAETQKRNWKPPENSRSGNRRGNKQLHRTPTAALICADGPSSRRVGAGELQGVRRRHS